MFSITTTYTSSATGATKVLAKGHGKQRTITADPAKSADANHASAAGTLLNALMDSRQRAMVLHPSGGQRVRMEHTSDAGGRMRFRIDV